MRIFGPSRDEVTTKSTKKYIRRLKVLLAKYYSGVQIKRKRWVGHAALMAEKKDSYKVLVGKPEGKRPFGSPRLSWDYNIRIHLQEVG